MMRKGFTIVELLIVIVVIGILASISIVAYSGIQERARITKANSDLVTLEKAIMLARIKENKKLIEITGTGCTQCGNHSLYVASLNAIAAASGANLDSLKVGDPWGVDYFIDENEGEGAPANWCVVMDIIKTKPDRTGVTVRGVPFYTCTN